MQQKNPAQYYFEVVEHNEFKRLVHLSLKTGPATDAEIKQHMAETIIQLKVSTLSFGIYSWCDNCATCSHNLCNFFRGVDMLIQC